jgi:hypothetical protein
MGSKLYVGNLSYNTTSSDLETLCSAHGTVQSAEVIQDRDTGQSKGFGFVQMGGDAEAQAVITALNGHQMDGRALTGAAAAAVVVAATVAAAVAAAAVAGAAGVTPPAAAVAAAAPAAAGVTKPHMAG